jgi:hypothetical protein
MAGKNFKGLIFPCLIFLFFSCQSAPKFSGADLEKKASLPFESGAFVYIFADAVQARSIIDLLPVEELNNRQVKQMLDRTRFFAAALFSQESGRRFQIAAEGNYPRSQASVAMSLNKSWQKRRSHAGGKYWYSPSNGLSIMLGASYAYAAASLTGEPFEPFTPLPGLEIPKSFIEFRQVSYGDSNSILSFWIPNPPVLLSRIFAGLPVQSVKNLFINIYPVSQEQYEAVIRLQFENTSHARGMATILSIASGFSSDPLLLILLANPPVVNGSAIDIRSAPLGEKEMKILLELFSVK